MTISRHQDSSRASSPTHPDVSISLHGAPSVATNSAQIIMLDESLNELRQLFDIATQFETNMQNNFTLSAIPGVLCTGGVFLFGFGLVSGVVLYSLGLAAGLLNATSPLRNAESG